MVSTARVSSPSALRTRLAPVKEVLAFASVALRSPSQVGAVTPASRWLARAITRELAASGCRTVVELGPGTGAITRAMLAQRHLFDRFVAVERDVRFVRWLRHSFPGIEVVQACASEIDQVVEHGVPTAIVSSLPFRSMSPEESEPCIGALRGALALSAGSRLIQYSYGFGARPPFASPANGLRWSRAGKVFLNVPPATVWTLAHAD